MTTREPFPQVQATRVARRPSPEALAAAENVASRVKGADAPVRRLFVERGDMSAPTPMANMLRGGRGGQVRLKLFLSFLWFARKPPHELAYPARAWAQLLDLKDPAGLGARRINDAVAWLERHGYVRVHLRPGQPSVIMLLEESGSQRPYESPGAVFNRLREDPPAAEAHRYLKVPASLWTSGWTAVLSGRALAMLLVLFCENRPGDKPLWISPRMGKMRYDLADETRSKGLDELRRAGLVTVARRTTTADAFDFQRMRNVYSLKLDQLQIVASVPQPVT